MGNKEFFNQMAERWDQICYHDEKKLSLIVDSLGLVDGDKALDVGCGTGVMLPFLFNAVGEAGELLALDYAEEMIRRARQKHHYSNLNFLCGDLEDLELKPDYFDCVMCYSVFPHFEKRQQTLLKLIKSLKGEGKLCICHSESRQQINQCHQEAGNEVAEDLLPPAQEVVDLLQSMGLSPIKSVDNDSIYLIVAQKKGSLAV